MSFEDLWKRMQYLIHIPEEDFGDVFDVYVAPGMEVTLKDAHDIETALLKKA